MHLKYLTGLLLCLLLTVYGSAQSTYLAQKDSLLGLPEEQAIEGFKSIVKTIEQRDTLALFYHHLARVYDWQYELDSAIRVNHKAVNLRRELADTMGLSFSLYNMGYYFYWKNEPDSARYFYREVLNLGQGTQNAKRGAALLELARLEIDTKEDYAAALILYDQLEREMAGGALSARDSAVIGNMYLERSAALNSYERPKEALLAVKQSELGIRFNRSLADDYNVAGCLNNLGNALETLEQYRGAMNAYEAAAAAFSSIDDAKEQQSLALSNKAFVMIQLDRAKEALPLLEQAITLREAALGSGLHPGKALIYDNLGLAYLQLGKASLATASFQQGMLHAVRGFQATLEQPLPALVQIRDSCDRKLDILALLEHQAQALAVNQQQEAALETIMLADAVIDLLRKERQSREAKLYWRGPARRLYEQGIELAHVLKRQEQLFYFLEKSRAVLLYEALLEKGDSLSSMQPIRLAEAQGRFTDAESVVLYFFFGKERYYTILLTQEELFVNKIDKKPIKPIVQWLDLIRDPDRYLREQQRADSLGRMLYNELIPQEARNKSRLLVIPDNILNFVPFGALRTEDAGFMLEKQQLNQAYSLSVLAQQNAQSSVKTYPFGLVGFAPFSEAGQEGLPLLDWKNDELRHIGKQLGARVFKGSAATLDRWQALAGQYEVVHLSTHARAGTDSTHATIFFHDQALTFPELFRLHLPASMVCLSACETQLGSTYEGEGVMSIASGLAYAGVGAVTSSLWRVDQSATRSIYERYFTALQAGVPSATALRTAQLAYLQDKSLDGSRRIPYYWAGMLHLGTSQPLALRPQKMDWFVWPFVVLLAVFTGVWWWRRR